MPNLLTIPEVMSMGMFETLAIGTDNNAYMQRVPGGWMYNVTIYGGNNTTTSSCFIPIINIAHDKLMM